MARVIYSVPVTQFIGSIGGTTFQSNRSGFIVRQKPTIPRRRALLQNSAMLNFVRYSQLFRNEAPANKVLWDNFAAANPHITLWNISRNVSGIHWYITINSYLALLGIPLVSVPPVYSNPTALPVMSALINVTGLFLTSASPFGLITEQILVWATSPLTSSVAIPRPKFRYIGNFPALNFGNIDITSYWEATFNLIFSSALEAPGNQIVLAVTKVTLTDCIPLPYSFARS